MPELSVLGVTGSSGVKTMKAAVIRAVGGPEVIQIERRRIPLPAPGEVPIRVMAFGIHRSELFTRQGFLRNVKFPRILGIELVGKIEKAPGGEFSQGESVASVMAGMGRPDWQSIPISTRSLRLTDCWKAAKRVARCGTNLASVCICSTGAACSLGESMRSLPCDMRAKFGRPDTWQIFSTTLSRPIPSGEESRCL